jgi:hypothetical protein
MRMYWLAAVGLLVAGPLSAQNDKAAIVGVIDNVFKGMRTRDTALMRSMFVPTGGRLLGVEAKDGKSSLQVIDPSGWIGAVGRGTGPAWDERTFAPTVEVDDNIAHVWTYYEFWRGTTLSHCGYDSFSLVKLTDGWRIAQVADSRRTDCKPR